jgi:hypothetical protein
MTSGGIRDRFLAGVVIGALIGLVTTVISAFFGLPVLLTGPVTGALIVVALRVLGIWKADKR